MTKPRKLTAKQELFVDAFVGEAAGNATEAARIAGYKGGTRQLQVQGSVNLSKPIIKDTIAKARAKLARKWNRLTPEEFHGILYEIASGENASNGERLKALEVYGRASGAFTETRRHVGPNGGPVEVAAVPIGDYLEQYTDNDLEALEEDISGPTERGSEG